MPLHPRAKLFVEQLAQQDRPGWHEMPISESRQIFSNLKGTFGRGPDLHRVEDRSLDGVPVRIYRPISDAASPVIMFFHGGGFVIGDLDTHDAVCRRLASESGCVVIAVDYRLAPEHPFPAAIDDCFTATSYVAKHATELSVEAERMIVCGDSAGGNLATTVALRARDAGGPMLCGQVLIYPVINPDYETGSYRLFATGHGLTLETMKWFWEQYMQGVEATDCDRAWAIPTLGKLAGLPPAHVVVAEYDVLRDEGLAYAKQLADAGVSTTTQQYDGMLHGFVHFAGFFEDGVTATQDVAQVIQDMVR